VIPVKRSEELALFYLYRPGHLKKDLKDPKAQKILKSKGYIPENPDKCVAELVARLKTGGSFPHEIGLFLGYPPADVEGFIKDPRSGVKCSGYWKAYSEPEKAMETFERFRICTKTYREMNKKGKNLTQLAVKTA
jgi:hypothetical protein